MALGQRPQPRLDGEPVWPQPLDDDRYAECVEIYEAASNQRSLLLEAIAARIAAVRAQDALRLLSIGSGSGEFDGALLDQLAARFAQTDYTGVDPNSQQCETAQQRLGAAGSQTHRVGIVNDTFRPERLGGAYDVVLFIHSLYYFPDPGATIDAALGLLVPGGQLIIAHAPNEELNVLADRFWAQSMGRTSWFAGDIADALAARGLSWDVQRIDAVLDASGCPGCTALDDEGQLATATTAGRAVADFIAQVEIDRLPDDTRAQCYLHLGRIVRTMPSGARYFRHPVDVFSVSADA